MADVTLFADQPDQPDLTDITYSDATNNGVTFCADQPDQPYQTDVTYSAITNDVFLTAIFGATIDTGRPVVCSFAGDPENNGWHPKAWPCKTSNNELNWYVAPAVFVPDDQGRYRAQKRFGRAVYAVMLDDLGGKIPLPRIAACPPSWLLETSPSNFQAGYIFATPVTDHKQAEALKDALIEAGLCDAGASGATARWMRMPMAVNGKTKYGNPSPRCRLTQWSPDLRYTIEEIIDALELTPPQPTRQPGRKTSAIGRNVADDVYTPRSDENEVLAALKKRGLYKSPLGSGRHDVTCPWVHEHTDQVDHGSAYFEPSDLYPIGGYKCLHSHGDQHRIGSLLESLGVSFRAAKHKPTIKVEAGELHRIVDAAERELAASNRYYQRGGLIVSINTDPESRATFIKPVSPPALLRALSGAAVWTRYDARSSSDVVCDPPQRHIGVLFDSEGYNHLPALAGIARQPYLRPDASLVMDAGYDAPTGLFGVFDARQFTVVPSPTPADARAALAALLALLTEFDFATDHDRAAAVAGMLTATIRPSLPAAPLFHIRAPQIASGKSYLSGIFAAFASPAMPSAVAFPTNEEECQKLLLATLLEAPACVIFDNLTTDLIPFKSMCSALTEEHLTGRILGVSKTATVGTRSLFLSSGNNVEAIRDMARRCITIALDPQVETPAARSFAGDPLGSVNAARERYVSLTLAIIRAWVVAGSPITPCKPLASYGQWSTWVRQPLLWLGLADPAECVFRQLAQDPDRETLGRLLHAWHTAFGSTPTMTRDAVNRADLGQFGSTMPSTSLLKEVMRDIAEERGEINRRRLGRWIARHQGRIVDGLRFERASGTTSAEQWFVKSVTSVSSVG